MIIIGKIKAISISKIKKIIVIRKKCNEKGIRDKFMGLNPHSNGEHFSRSMIDFLEIKRDKKIKILEIIKIISEININERIIYINFY